MIQRDVMEPLKIHHELLENGWHVSLKRVQRRMALLGIHSIVIKNIAIFSDNKPVTEKENILKQDFTATGINQKMVHRYYLYPYSKKMDGHILHQSGFLIVGKIIVWAYGTTMSADLAVKVVENACLNVFPDTSGIIPIVT